MLGCDCKVPYRAPNRMPAPVNPAVGFRGLGWSPGGPLPNDYFRAAFAVPTPTRGNPPRLTAVGFGTLAPRAVRDSPRVRGLKVLFQQYQGFASAVSGRSIGLDTLRDVWKAAAYLGHFPKWDGTEASIDNTIDGISGDTPASMARVLPYAKASGVLDARAFVDQFFFPAQQRYGNHWAVVTDQIGSQILYDVADAYLARVLPATTPLVTSAPAANFFRDGQGTPGPNARPQALRMGRLVGGGRGLGSLGAGVSTSGAQSAVSYGSTGAAIAGPIGFAVGAVVGYLLGSKNYLNVNSDNAEEDQDVLDIWPQYRKIAGTVAGRDIGLPLLERIWRGAVYSSSDFTLNNGRKCFHNGCLKYPGNPDWIAQAIGTIACSRDANCMPNAVAKAAAAGVSDPRQIVDQFFIPMQTGNPPWARPNTQGGRQVLIDVADAYVAQKGAPYFYGQPVPASQPLQPQPVSPATPTIPPLSTVGPIAIGDATDQQLASQGYIRVGTTYGNYPSNNAPVRLYQKDGQLFVLTLQGMVPYGSPAQAAVTGSAGNGIAMNQCTPGGGALPCPPSNAGGIDPNTMRLIQQYLAQGLTPTQASIGAQSYLSQQGVPITPDVQAQVNSAAGVQRAGIGGGGLLGVLAAGGAVLALMFATAHPKGGPAAVHS